MKTIKKVLHDWFTGPANDNFEQARFLLFSGFWIGVGLQGYAIYQGAQFDVTAFFQAIGAYILLGGAGTAVKDFGAAKSAKGAA